jgi:hypothetical protein
MLRLLGIFGVVGFILAPVAAKASLLASDSQADPAYTAWDPGDNGGTGWGGGWTFRNQSNTVLTTTSGQRGWFVANSVLNNSGGTDSNSDSDINTPSLSTGKAWGLYSNGTTLDQVYAIRPFNGTLSVGQTLKWDMDNGNIAASQVVGLRLLSNTSDIASRVFELRFVGGATFYEAFGGPSQTTSIGFSREGLHCEYTLTGASTYSLKIVRLENGSTQTLTGSNVNANAIAGLAFKNQFAGSGDAANGYLNNIAITPEPCTMILLGIGGMIAATKRRRGA